MRAAIACFALGILCAATASSAKDVCVLNTTGTFKFVKAKLPKKPGTATPLTGFLVDGFLVAPVTGSAVARGDGSIMIGLYVHGGQADPDDTYVDFRMLADATWNATGSYRNIDAPDVGIAAAWTPIPCSSLNLP